MYVTFKILNISSKNFLNYFVQIWMITTVQISNRLRNPVTNAILNHLLLKITTKRIFRIKHPPKPWPQSIRTCNYFSLSSPNIFPFRNDITNNFVKIAIFKYNLMSWVGIGWHVLATARVCYWNAFVPWNNFLVCTENFRT